MYDGLEKSKNVIRCRKNLNVQLHCSFLFQAALLYYVYNVISYNLAGYWLSGTRRTSNIFNHRNHSLIFLIKLEN